MLGGAVFHSTIGFLLDLRWSGAFENGQNGVRAYLSSDFRVALLVIPVASVLGAAGLFLAMTHPRLRTAGISKS
jgi:hypothetical protein